MGCCSSNNNAITHSKTKNKKNKNQIDSSRLGLNSRAEEILNMHKIQSNAENSAEKSEVVDTPKDEINEKKPKDSLGSEEEEEDSLLNKERVSMKNIKLEGKKSPFLKIGDEDKFEKSTQEKKFRETQPNKKESFGGKLPKIEDKYLLQKELSKKRISILKKKSIKIEEIEEKRVEIVKEKPKKSEKMPKLSTIKSATTNESRIHNLEKRRFDLEPEIPNLGELTAKNEKIDFIYKKFGSKEKFEKYLEERKENIKEFDKKQNGDQDKSSKSNNFLIKNRNHKVF